jgi:phospholipase C
VTLPGGGVSAVINAKEPAVPAETRENALDHTVVVMFENRSFDNLLGRLYEPGEVPSFEGVIGRELSNPIPSWAEHGAERGTVPYGVAPNMNTPWPDPGEELPHMNTQLFGSLDEGNRAVLQPEEKFNEPDGGQQPTMDGFITDYISCFEAELGRYPTYDEYAQFMTGYTPEQMPVVSDIARGFATFDHWFCDVPSCTFPNRSFFHAATSSGYVVNMTPPDSFVRNNDAETLFERLESRGLSWRVYCDPPSHYSLTGLIHAPRLQPRFATHFFSTDQFFEDAATGELPTYSFIEPQIIGHAHNDMHPAYGMMTPGVTWDPPSALIGGEDLLARVYNAVKSSSTPDGSNFLNTTLMVTFDENGGTYDHVPPPPASPPQEGAPAGQFGFRFDRSGVRIPTLAISAWIPERTVVTDLHRATSLIATLRDRWDLGRPFSRRDAEAQSFDSIFTLEEPRMQEDWPEIVPRPVEPMPESLLPLDAPLQELGQALFAGVLALAKGMGATVPEQEADAVLTGAEAIEICQDALGDIFPLMRS